MRRGFAAVLAIATLALYLIGGVSVARGGHLFMYASWPTCQSGLDTCKEWALGVWAA